MANLKVSEQAYPSTRYTEAAAPATPATGEVIIYAKADGNLYQKDDAGTETSLAGAAGSVATDAIWDAKGDLAGGTGANTAAKLTVGANDTILMADSGQSTGLKWVASQTPSTQAFGDSAAEGTADTYARGDHKHAMPADPGSGATGRVPIVSSPWQVYTDAPSNAEALASNGGTLIVPIYVPAPFRYTTLTIWSTDTASARAAEHRLYKYGGSTMDFVTGTDGTFSFTPGAAAERTSNVSGAPVSLTPGGYILAIRNTSASQSFGVGYVNANGTYYNTSTLHATQTLGSALGSTLTTSGWSNGARLHAVRLRATDIFGA